MAVCNAATLLEALLRPTTRRILSRAAAAALMMQFYNLWTTNRCSRSRSSLLVVPLPRYVHRYQLLT